MTKKELNRHNIISKLIDKEINGRQASGLLHLSLRHTQRLKARVKNQGPQALIHANRGKPSNRAIPQEERDKIAQLLHQHYSDFKPGFASEKLEEIHNIKRDPKTIRQIMINEKLWKPKQKQKKEYRAWRQRKACFGEMEQFDGSYHHWFENRGPYCCLLAAIDDATGIPVKAQFADDEGVFPVFQFWLEYLKEHGKPYSIYLDKFSTYKMTQKVALENPDTKTQFQRAMQELRIEPISANSCQAKGRVERLFETFQDRLVKELRLANISTIAVANIFLKETFLPQYSLKYSVEPRSKANLHQPLSMQEQENLQSVFSRQDTRVIRNDFTINFNKQWFQLSKNQPATIRKKDKIIVEEWLNGSVHFRLRGKDLNFEMLPERPEKKAQTIPWVIPANKKSAYIPPIDHPWRQEFILNSAKKCDISKSLKV
ncbi:MAG: ISNCY family transposase [bacterium]